jgi:hypothetical protein
MPAPALFPLRPPPAAGGSCPRDASPLTIARLVLPGARFLLEGSCDRCGHVYLQDLPSGHALVYPSSLDLTTGEARGQWFETELREGSQQPDREPVSLDVDVRTPCDQAVLLNALDPIYGHGLLKLLNTQWVAEQARTSGRGTVVLVPAALAHLVPADVSEAWVVDEPLARLRGWLSQLDERLHTELSRFRSAWLAPAHPHPHPSTFDLAHFTGRLDARRLGEPSVVLCLRPDRLWGRSPRDQRRRYGQLVATLRQAFPALGAAAVGTVGSELVPDGVEGLVAPRPGPDQERAWLEACAGADLAVGVHGSNMLLPSGLARATLELLPADRFGNFAQATLATDPDALASLYRHRTLYGESDLRDVAPARVAAVAREMLVGGAHFRSRHLGPVAGQHDLPVRHEEPLFGTPPASRWQPPPA